MSKFNVGDKVIAISKQAHKDDPESYPKVGTIGYVQEADGYVQEAEGGSKLYKVQWQLGSTSCNDLWYVREDEIELFNRYMTNEEIWEMLRSKMQKNGLTSKVNIIKTNIDNYPNDEVEIIKAYYESDVHNAIVLAYRSGYERAMKGRPFKFSEKKKKKGGHWEPVDPENLPKEGTKVRYSRECGAYNSSVIKIGDTGVVVWEGMFTPMWFGIRPDSPRSYLTWIDFGNGAESCLDIWVEDDE